MKRKPGEIMLAGEYALGTLLLSKIKSCCMASSPGVSA